jgi:hypothetical protein
VRTYCRRKFTAENVSHTQVVQGNCGIGIVASDMLLLQANNALSKRKEPCYAGLAIPKLSLDPQI